MANQYPEPDLLYRDGFQHTFGTVTMEYREGIGIIPVRRGASDYITFEDQRPRFWAWSRAGWWAWENQ